MKSVQELGNATSVALPNADRAVFLRQQLKSLLLMAGKFCALF